MPGYHVGAMQSCKLHRLQSADIPPCCVLITDRLMAVTPIFKGVAYAADGGLPGIQNIIIDNFQEKNNDTSQ